MKESHHITIPLNEGFDRDELTQLLTREVGKIAPNSSISIHFNITLGFFRTQEYAEFILLMRNLDEFFFDLLVLHSISGSSGKVYSISPHYDWNLYIELPDMGAHCDFEEEEEEEKKDSESTLGFLDHLPTLQLIEHRKCVDDEEFDISPKVQTICKYIKVIKNGKINTLYNEKNINKYSQLDDLDENECRRLLDHTWCNGLRDICGARNVDELSVCLDRTKINWHHWTHYLYRRFDALDKSFFLNYYSGWFITKVLTNLTIQGIWLPKWESK